MHLTFHFLHRLSQQLHGLLVGCTIQGMYWYDESDLWLIVTNRQGKKEALKLHFESETCFWMPAAADTLPTRHIPERFHQVFENKIIAVRQARHNRAFCLEISGGFSLMFIYYGAKSDVWLFDENDEPLSDLRKMFKAGPPVRPGAMHQPGNEPTIEQWQAPEADLKLLWPTLGATGRRAMQQAGFDTMSGIQRLQLAQMMQHLHENGPFYICVENARAFLSFVPMATVLHTADEPLQASALLAAAFFKYNRLETQKNKLLAAGMARAKSLETALQKAEAALHGMRSEVPPERMADLLMAYAHTVPARSASVELPDFESGAPVLIKLKQTASVHKNAENYYRKAKNRHLQLATLENKINAYRRQLEEAELQLQEVEALSDGKSLQRVLKSKQKEKKAVSAPEAKFKSFEHMGFSIYVGRNAANNDELTFGLAGKDDLWLHARDVAGSHVIIRQPSGQTVPRPVIEKAASVAAYYSKRKNDSLCPVMLTRRKYVRKQKGMPAGMVKVEKSETLMAVPGEI